MPHSIKIDSAKEQLFILHNLAYAAKEYAARHDLNVEPGTELSEHANYFPWIKMIVSERLLEIAMTTRLTYDVASENCKEYGPDNWDAEATEQYLDGRIEITDVRPSVREVCNKIIHAKTITMVRVSSDGGKTEEWNGNVSLSGEKGRTSWQCEFSIPPLCSAIEHFLALASENIDWYDLYTE